jgi:hypothetical protein
MKVCAAVKRVWVNGDGSADVDLVVPDATDLLEVISKTHNGSGLMVPAVWLVEE